MKELTKKSILKLKQSSTLVINEKCKKLINQGKKIYQFGFGQSPFPVPEKIIFPFFLFKEDSILILIKERDL